VSGRVRSLDVFVVTLPRDTPYLGGLRPGEEVNPQGYFVRLGNRTVYASVDRTVVVRVLTEDGVEGWGETYGLAAPRATTEIMRIFWRISSSVVIRSMHPQFMTISMI